MIVQFGPVLTDWALDNPPAKTDLLTYLILLTYSLTPWTKLHQVHTDGFATATVSLSHANSYTMLTRRLFTRSTTPSTLLRTITTSTAHQRSPALGDITPNGAAKFDARQTAFREEVREAQKAKEKQDSQSSVTAPTAPYNVVPGPAPTTSAASDAFSASSHDHVALGSLSTHDPGANRESSQQQETSKRKGALSSLIYGTHEGQQMDHEIEKSFSQVLARGKYVHSIVMHTVKPDKVDEYVDLVGDWYPKVASTPEHHVHLVGSWRTEVGDCDTFGKFFTLLFRSEGGTAGY